MAIAVVTGTSTGIGLEAPETRTGRLIGKNMSKFLEGSKFFRTEYPPRVP